MISMRVLRGLILIIIRTVEASCAESTACPLAAHRETTWRQEKAGVVQMEQHAESNLQ